MTTIAAPDTGAPIVAPYGRRFVNVLRLHIANPWPTIITPWLIFAGIFAANVAIWYAIVYAAGGRDKLNADAFATNGGASWIYTFLMVVAIQAMNLTFRFALGLGMTRRDYYVGTCAYFTGLAVMFSTGSMLMALIERATNGWGLEGYFFAPFVFEDKPIWELWFSSFAYAMLSMAVGILAATMWVRWQALGLYVFFGALLVLVVGLVWVVSWARAWDSFWGFFFSNTLVEVFAWSLIPTVVFGIAGYLFMRRATPRA